MLERGHRRYSFLHLTFEEYLAARALLDSATVQDADAEIHHRAADPGWREVLRLALASVAQKEAQRLVVLLNCCHAGGVGDAVLGESEALSGEAPPPEFYRPLAVGSGQVVISSSRPGQKSGARSRISPQHTTLGKQYRAALDTLGFLSLAQRHGVTVSIGQGGIGQQARQLKSWLSQTS